MSYSEEVAKKLNELLHKSYDAEKGFKDAAENVKNAELKSFFKSKAQERYDFGHEIKAEIGKFGEKPDKGSTVAGDAHRVWMDLKTKLSSDKEESVLEEAARGEKAAIEDYEDILKDSSIPASTANILMKQKNAIQESLNKVKVLEKQFD